MTRSPERNVNTFNQDVNANQGYLYTTNAQLSSIVANKRLSDIALQLAPFEGKKVVDIGCGDGTYTLELYDRAKPASIYAVDPADNAIEAAKKRVENRNVQFAVDNAYQLNIPDDTYDIAYIRGVLHHMDDPKRAIAEALRVARQILIIEPNGYNPVLKVLEKVSPYHIKHDEKSYFPPYIDQWISEGGGRVVESKYGGLVPMFSPDWLVKLVKPLEPLIEPLPFIKHVSCAVYVVFAERK